MLRQAEVDEYRAYGAVVGRLKHDIVGLYVEVANAVLMQHLHGLHNGFQQAEGLLFAELAFLGNVIAKALAAKILHDVIGGIVSLEDLVEADDVGMRETDFLQSPRLVDKVFARVLHAVARRVGIRHAGVVETLAVIAQEELLEGEIHRHAYVAHLYGATHAVGDTEASLT